MKYLFLLLILLIPIRLESKEVSCLPNGSREYLRSLVIENNDMTCDCLNNFLNIEWVYKQEKGDFGLQDRKQEDGKLDELAVAKNPSVCPKVLRRLWNSYNIEVKRAVAFNENTPIDILKIAFKSKDKGIASGSVAYFLLILNRITNGHSDVIYDTDVSKEDIYFVIEQLDFVAKNAQIDVVNDDVFRADFDRTIVKCFVNKNIKWKDRYYFHKKNKDFAVCARNAVELEMPFILREIESQVPNIDEKCERLMGSFNIDYAYKMYADEYFEEKYGDKYTQSMYELLYSMKLTPDEDFEKIWKRLN